MKLVCVLFASLLLMTACLSTPFPSVGWTSVDQNGKMNFENGSIADFDGTLNSASGFDRLVFFDLQVDDPEHLLPGYPKLMVSCPEAVNGSRSFADVSFDTGGGKWTEGHHFQGLVVFQAKLDSIVLDQIHYFDFDLNERGQATREAEADVPLRIPFKLAPRAVNYLGTIHIAVARKGETVTGYDWARGPGVWTQSETGFDCAVSVEQNEAGRDRDFATLTSKLPSMKLPDDVRQSVLVIAPTAGVPGDAAGPSKGKKPKP